MMIQMSMWGIAGLVLIGLIVGWSAKMLFDHELREYRKRKYEERMQTDVNWAFEFSSGAAFQTIAKRDDLPVALFFKAKMIVNLSDCTWYRNRDTYVPNGTPLDGEAYHKFINFPIMPWQQVRDAYDDDRKRMTADILNNGGLNLGEGNATHAS
jgi:hypothetical protein